MAFISIVSLYDDPAAFAVGNNPNGMDIAFEWPGEEHQSLRAAGRAGGR